MKSLNWIVSILLFLAGIWLVIAPFATGFQPARLAWTSATSNSVWNGVVLTGLSLAGMLISGLLGALELLAGAKPQAAPAEAKRA
jgi:hypothetical protein